MINSLKLQMLYFGSFIIGVHTSKKVQIHMWILVLWEISFKCKTWTYVLQTKNVMSNNPMTSSGYNYWNEIGNLANIAEQASLIALGNSLYI